MNEVNVLFENWFKQEYRWELKRSLHLRKSDDGQQYHHEKVHSQFVAFKAALKIAGLINE